MAPRPGDGSVFQFYCCYKTRNILNINIYVKNIWRLTVLKKTTRFGFLTTILLNTPTTYDVFNGHSKRFRKANSSSPEKKTVFTLNFVTLTGKFGTNKNSHEWLIRELLGGGLSKTSVMKMLKWEWGWGGSGELPFRCRSHNYTLFSQTRIFYWLVSVSPQKYIIFNPLYHST